MTNIETKLLLDPSTNTFYLCYKDDLDATKGMPFTKLNLKLYTKILKGTKDTATMAYILEETDWSNNVLVTTFDAIALKTNQSRRYVANTMKYLQDSDFIRKQTNGVYMVNPRILMKGSGSKEKILNEAYDKRMRLKEVYKIMTEVTRREREERKYERC